MKTLSYIIHFYMSRRTERERPENIPPGDFVGNLLQWDQSKFIGPARGLDKAVKAAAASGLWTPTIQERTERFINPSGLLNAENYLQAAVALNNHSEETQDALYNVTLQANRKLGKRAGQFFLLSYPKMIHLGQDPEEYLEIVQKAKDAGGSLFAAKFARYLPYIIEGGGNQNEFGQAALSIKYKDSFKMSSLFMSLAPEMAMEGEGNIYDYADKVLKSIDKIGPELTSWAMPAYVYLQHRAGREVQQTQDELSSIREREGEKAALWYAAGLRRIGNALPSTIPSRTYHSHELFPGDIVPTIQTFDAYRSSFLEVFTKLGVTAASFYARTVEFTDPTSYKDTVAYVQSVLGKSLFDKGLWAIIKASSGIWNNYDAAGAWIYFNYLVSRFRKYSNENFSAIMDYAIKTANEQRHPHMLHEPGTTSDGYYERYGADAKKSYVHDHEGETVLFNKWCFYGRIAGEEAGGK